MNRTRSIIYVAIAILMVLAIAFAYQFRQLQRQLRTSVQVIPTEPKSRGAEAGFDDTGKTSARPDVLVKFRSGVSAEDIERITGRLNDQVQDQIDAVPGLNAIDDRDNAEPTATVAEYRALAEVEYAEPNYEISIDQTSAGTSSGNIEPDKQWFKIRAPNAIV